MSKNISYLPAEGLAGLKQNFLSDATSGFLVFLLALPLSLGIAKASDFPIIFGLVTAIIGGVIVSFFAGSRLTIKGPAAGLIVICSGAVAEFGGGEVGWQIALGAIIVAGIIQIAFGFFKLGNLGDFFPTAAIHGMLAAIGIIIMSKQIHGLLGINPLDLKGKEPLELILMIPNSIMHENAHITEIGLSCLAILVIFSLIKNKIIQKIPAPLIVLIIAVPLGIMLNIKTEGKIQNFALVKVGSFADAFNGQVIKANFSGITQHTLAFIKYVVLFALIGSLESLLTVKAIDGMDPYKRTSNSNKDLSAIGFGNILAALFGGLPMISEVARSSANVSYGAKTRWANFFHGIFLLVAVLFAVPLIEMIPNAALAAMLTFVGFKLAHPREFKHMWYVGREQFIIFVSTIIITLASDLLVGVAFGIIIKIIIHLYNGAGLKNMFKSDVEIETNEEHINVKIKGASVFTNLIPLKNKLQLLPDSKNVNIDLSNAKLVDHTTIVTLNNISENYRKNGGLMNVKGFENHKQLSRANTSTRVKKK